MSFYNFFSKVLSMCKKGFFRPVYNLILAKKVKKRRSHLSDLTFLLYKELALSTPSQVEALSCN